MEDVAETTGFWTSLLITRVTSSDETLIWFTLLIFALDIGVGLTLGEDVGEVLALLAGLGLGFTVG